MSFALEANISDKKLKQALRELHTSTSDLKPILSQIGYALVDEVEQNFESQSFFGSPWKPSIRAKNQGGKTLQDTGLLASSIGFSVDDDRVVVGTSVEYAPIHQLGGKAGRGRKTIIEPRAFLPISKTKEMPTQTQEEILQIVRSGISISV